MLLKPFRLIQATPQQNRRAQMDFRGCTKTSSSNAAGRFLLRFTRLTSHLIEELGTTELLEDEGTRVNWDGDFRWFKVSEDVQQPQLLAFFFFWGGKFPNVSSCFHDQFLHTEFSFLLQRMPCAFWVGQIHHLSGAEDLGGELCNASPLGTCLRGCGRYWCLKADINVEDVTVPSHYYDAFVSHEWGSSGLLKVLTLAPWLRFVWHQGWGMKTDGSDGLLGKNGFRWIDWIDCWWTVSEKTLISHNLLRIDSMILLIQTLLRKSFEKLPDKHWDHDLQLGGSNCCYFSREPFFGCAARFWALAGWWAHSGHRLCYFFRLHLLLATHPGISAYKFDPFVKLLELVRLDTLGLLLTSNVMTLAERAGWWQKARNGTCSEECFCKPHLMFVDTWLNYAELELIVLNHTICIYLWDWRAQYGSIISIILSLQDKLCIEQKDAREKTKGTLGVG